MKYMKCALLGTAAALLSAQAMAQVTFYQGDDFHGRAFTTNGAQSNFKHGGFNDKASSVIVDKGNWQVCEDANYRGHCVMLRPGSYDSLKRMGMNNRVSSARRISDRDRSNRYDRPDPMPAPDYAYRRRPNERVYEANVTSVHAVMGPPERHCWIERQQVDNPGAPNVGAGIVGGIIGGILGHEISHGKGVATAGGAVAGAAIGANVGRSGDSYDRDVQRCSTAERGPPDYWEVTYTFHNVEHRVQMSAPPGRTISVNRNGEPRQ